MTFSVVTVVRNAASEIGKTLHSVVSQSCKDYEYIVVDGASTDGTLDIVESYREYIDILLSEQDSGIYNAMNKGLDLAHGGYVVFMNAGDLFASPDVLSQIATHVACSDYAFIYGDYVRTSSKGTTQVIPSRSIDKNWYGMIASHQSMFYNVGFLRQNNIRYDESYKIAADYKLTSEVIGLADSTRILKLPICISKFQLGGTSTQYMNYGLKEADRVRKEVMDMPWLGRAGIHIMLRIARVMRENEIFKSIYSRLRY